MYDHLPALALTIRQPWANAIVRGWKDIENRTWPTKVRGPICIHCSAFNRKNFEEDSDSYLDVLHEHVHRLGGVPIEHQNLDGLTFGAIIGTATIIDCVTRHDSPWFFGAYGFVLADQQILPKPIPLSGKQGFFDWRKRLEPAAPTTSISPDAQQKGLFDV